MRFWREREKGVALPPRERKEDSRKEKGNTTACRRSSGARRRSPSTRPCAADLTSSRKWTRPTCSTPSASGGRGPCATASLAAWRAGRRAPACSASTGCALRSEGGERDQVSLEEVEPGAIRRRERTHVGLDQVAGSEGAHQRELARHDARGDDAREAPGIVAGRLLVGAGNAEHLQARVLRGEERAAADGAALDRGHRHGDEQVLAIVGPGGEAGERRQSARRDGKGDRVRDARLHQGHAHGRLDVLGGILPGGEEDGLRVRWKAGQGQQKLRRQRREGPPTHG